jgi:hypothetical protein
LKFGICKCERKFRNSDEVKATSNMSVAISIESFFGLSQLLQEDVSIVPQINQDNIPPDLSFVSTLPYHHFSCHITSAVYTAS